ncbi:MAG: hypothetical protein ACPLW7_05105 [Minisyncoccia bacterium]
MDKEEQFSHIIDKIQELKNGKNPLDLSSKEDLAVGIMNLISMEEHFFFTYNKTKDNKYLELLNQTREVRKTLLQEIVKNPEGEVWCISKHLLAVTMRLMEVGTKKLSDGDKAKAQDLFDKAYLFWNIFWGLNLGLINVKDVKGKEDDSQESETVTLSNDSQNNNEKNKKLNVFSKLGDMIQQILDCCKE